MKKPLSALKPGDHFLCQGQRAHWLGTRGGYGRFEVGINQDGRKRKSMTTYEVKPKNMGQLVEVVE